MENNDLSHMKYGVFLTFLEIKKTGYAWKIPRSY